MVRSWYFNDSADEPKCGPHMPNPTSFLSLQEVMNKTGMEYFQFPSESIDTNPDYAELKRKRNYNYEDEITISPTALPDYPQKEKAFFTEHIHADEEIRYFVKGSGFFDIKDAEVDKWIRVECCEGEMIILPAGIFHRFTLDKNNFAHLKRLFSNEPCWKAINKPGADEHPIRKEYLKRMAVSN